MPISSLITDDLLVFLKNQYRLDWDTGVHGLSHWRRVRETGLKLAETNEANPHVVEAFAFLHDSQRVNEGYDDHHGWRACQFIRRQLAGSTLLALLPEEIELLCEACEGHTSGRIDASPTVQTCWDADRLDLMRVGIWPDKHFLGTEEARQDEMIQWAVEQSLAWVRGRGTIY